MNDLGCSQFDYKGREDQGWDFYWDNGEKKAASRKLYDNVASFYRVHLIKRTLNHFIRKHFPKGARLLHAGCGSGEVDRDILDDFRIIALDISKNALKIYERVNGNRAVRAQGSIFSLGMDEGSLDGIYNLGVMEHFTESDVLAILREFRRVLNANGRMVIFWPPEFGLSVIFFKVLRRLFGVLGHKNAKFHPDEILRVRSREQISTLFEKGGFEVIEYYFGPRDLFTYSIIVAVKKDA